MDSKRGQAWIIINGDEAEQFKPETVDYPTGQTCWIASELDKGFSIHWRNTDVFCQTAARIWVDGIECAGEIILHPNCEANISGRRTSASTVSPFKFSPLNLTDDDTFLTSLAHKELGLIRVEIWTINMAGTKPYSKIVAAEESKIHERSKKDSSHQIKFAEEVVQPPRSAAIVEYLEKSPLVTFTFKYRSIGLLTWHLLMVIDVSQTSSGPMVLHRTTEPIERRQQVHLLWRARQA
ncbi:hypothetical protein B0H12DRAFT_1098151 [Mycena haematopus]|nr:hypothetical protein B0H12DRAFT_1098151 [Mycena haematopus]